jgi:hypothetical protein
MAPVRVPARRRAEQRDALPVRHSPHDLAHFDVLRFTKAASADDFEKALLVRSRLGHLLP